MLKSDEHRRPLTNVVTHVGPNHGNWSGSFPFVPVVAC